MRFIITIIIIFSGLKPVIAQEIADNNKRGTIYVRKTAEASIDSIPQTVYSEEIINTSSSGGERWIFINEVEQLYDFAGGKEGFLKFMKKNLKYPKNAKKQKAAMTVTIYFMSPYKGKVSLQNMEIVYINKSLEKTTCDKIEKQLRKKAERVLARSTKRFDSKVDTEYKVCLDYLMKGW